MPSKPSLRIKLGIIYSVTAWFALAIWNTFHQTPPSIPDWVVIYTLAGLLILVQRFHIPLSDFEAFALETVYLIGFSFAYPIHLVVWAGLAYGLISALRYARGGRWYVQVMNASELVLSTLLARGLLSLLPVTYTPQNVANILPIVVYAIVYVGANFVFIMGFFYITEGKKAFAHTKDFFAPRVLTVYTATIVMGLVLALVLHDAGLAGALLFTGLSLLVAYSYRDYFKLASHFKQLAIRDELTGLHNHRHVHSLMDKLIEEQRSFGLLMLDIDHFKQYNDRLGHVQGDEALRSLSEICVTNRLPDEEVARYSGEEFAIVLPDYDLEQAIVKAESLRGTIADAPIPGKDLMPGKKFTVSVGVVAYPEMADNKKDLLMLVDDALFKGKFSGRNKVTIYSSVLDDMQKELDLDDMDREIITTIRVFMAILNSKDRYTYAHTERDARYVAALAEKIGLPRKQVLHARFGAFLHDIGKVEIPLEVLAKRGPLSREEWEIMKSHVQHSVNIAQPIQHLHPILPIIRHHHERFDGTGYPQGLAGEDIPLEARILTIADSFDAMTTSRPYQRKRTMNEAIAELRLCGGKHFDPALIEPFIEVVREIGLLADETSEEDAHH